MTVIKETGPVDPETVDLARLEAQTEGDRELLGELVTLFDDNRQWMLDELRAALETADGRALFRAAHRLRCSLTAVAATRAAAVALEMEEAAESGDVSHAIQRLTTLDTETDRVARVLKEMVAGRTVGR